MPISIIFHADTVSRCQGSNPVYATSTEDVFFHLLTFLRLLAPHIYDCISVKFFIRALAVSVADWTSLCFTSVLKCFSYVTAGRYPILLPCYHNQ